ncbi:MAG: RecG, partial [uncultured Ramlibacter sp.]
ADGRAGLHHGDRGRRGRAERVAHGHRACRAVWPLPAAPAAGTRGPGCRGIGLRPALCPGRERPAGRDGAGAAEGHGRHGGRLRDRPQGPRDPRARRVPGRPPVRCAAAAVRRPRHRRPLARARATARAGHARSPSRIRPAPHGALVGGKIGLPEGV